MSGTYAQTELNARLINGDSDAGRYAVVTERMRKIITAIAQDWSVKLGVPEDWLAVAFTLPQGQWKLATQISAGRITGIKHAASGLLLDRKSPEQVAALWSARPQDTDPSTFTSDPPSAYCILEPDGLVTMHFFPAGGSRGEFNALVVDVPPSSGVTAAATLLFSELALRGIEYTAAARAAMEMKAEDKTRLGITPDMIQDWQGTAREFLEDEMMRRARMQRPSHVPAQVR